MVWPRRPPPSIVLNISYNDQTWMSYTLVDPKNKRNHPLSSADINIFSPEIRKCCYINVAISYIYLVLNSFNFFWVFKIYLINMVTILMMSAKMATLNKSILKLKLWCYNFCPCVTNKILSRDSSYVLDLAMWPKFGNSSISVRTVIIILIL